MTSARSLLIMSDSADETLAVGQALARSFPRGVVLSLSGPLGSGKTVLTQGLCAALGVTDPVTSPTYTLENEYRGSEGRQVLHLDCFRLSGPDEFADLALSERLEENAVAIIEWGDRVDAALPTGTVKVVLEMEDDSEANERSSADESPKRRIRVELPAGLELESVSPKGADS